MTSLRDFLPPVQKQPDGPADETVPVHVESTSIVAAPPAAHTGVSKTLSLQTDASGRPDFSALVRQGANATRTVHASRNALVEKSRDTLDLSLPSAERTEETVSRTRAALAAVLEKQLSSAHKGAPSAASAAPTFIKYTPANAPAAGGGGQRIIKMMQAQVDPMEPPRFAQKKAPMNPPSPPVPVLHSPERKLSKEELADWKVPPVVSNWKNARGYTVPLDKRLAAQGGGEQHPPLSDRLAHFAEALYHAERSARADVEKRADLQRSVALRQKERKESQLRDLAARAREERSALGAARRVADSDPPPLAALAASVAPRVAEDRVPEPPAPPSPDVLSTGEPPRRRRSRFDIGPDGVHVSASQLSDRAVDVGGDDDDEGARRRDAIRRERRELREREMRARDARGDTSAAPTLKRSKLTRDRDRDVSERVALGQAVGTGGSAGELMYDQRLFNQGEREAGGMGGGFGAAEAYNVYADPLFKDRPNSSFQYRPKDSVLGNEAPSSRGIGGKNAPPRERPVEFERDVPARKENSDPFGLDKFLENARRGRPGPPGK